MKKIIKYSIVSFLPSILWLVLILIPIIIKETFTDNSLLQMGVAMHIGLILFFILPASLFITSIIIIIDFIIYLIKRSK